VFLECSLGFQGDRLSKKFVKYKEIKFTAIADQTNHKKKIESVAKQHFQFFSWFGFKRQAL